MLPRVRKRLANSYRRRVHPALRATLHRARFQRSEQQRDLVSLIIPVYNVEAYLRECLNSVIDQTYRNLEVVIVDDGSSDGSHEIAASYARWDPRFRIVRQANAGLGAARNTGVREAHGKYLAFADSDDTLPPDAIARMVHSLRTSRSDFVVGAPMRTGNGRTWASGWVKDVHAEDRRRIRLDDHPDILKNVFAWTKLFDADFFRRVVGGFPEGIRYEDQEPTAKAYVAGTFDVLAATVYYWRDREDGTSITQQKTDPQDLRDRLLVKKAVGDVISAGASKQTHEIWLAKAIGFDLRGYFEAVPRTNQAFFDQLRTAMRELEPRMTPDIWRLVPIVDRIPALAVLAGERDDVATAVVRRQEYGFRVPGEIRPQGIFLQRSALDDLAIKPPDELLQLGDVDVKVQAKATSLWWHGTTLHLEGYAFLTNVPYDPETCTTTVELVSADGVRVPLSVRQRTDIRVDLETKDAWNAHASAGFAVDIDPSELPLGASDPWRLEVTVEAGDACRRTARLVDCDFRGIGGTRPVAPAMGRVRWMAGFDDGNGFELRHTTDIGAPIVSLESLGRVIQLVVDDAEATMLRLTCRSLNRKVEFAGVRDKTTGHVKFTLSLPELLGREDTGKEHQWSMRVHGGDAEPRRLTYLGGADDLRRDSPEHNQLRAVMTRAGTLRLAQNRWWAVADEVEIDDRTLTVRGRISAPGSRKPAGRLVGQSQVVRSEYAHMRLSQESFVVRFPLDRDGSPPTIEHGFSVRLSVELDGRRQERWLKVAEDLQHRFPRDERRMRYVVSLSRTRQAAALWVRLRPPYATAERGRLAQRRLHSHFHTPTSAGGGLTDQRHPIALLECRDQDNVESVLAAVRLLPSGGSGVKLLYAVSDLRTPVPETVTAVLRHSAAYVDALHNGRFLISDTYFPFYYRKTPGQTYIHVDRVAAGAPDPVEADSLSLSRIRAREEAYWDTVVSSDELTPGADSLHPEAGRAVADLSLASVDQPATSQLP